MFSQIQLSLPDASSPWLFWIITMAMVAAFFVSFIIHIRKAGEAHDSNKTYEGYIAVGVVSGLGFIALLIYAMSIFYELFSKSVAH